MKKINSEVFCIVNAQVRVLASVPIITPFQDATMGPFNTYGLSILTIEDDEGYIGEVPVFSTYINILEKCLFPILFHSGAQSYQKLYSLLYWSIRNEGFRGQAAAVLGQLDMALHDLAARRSGQPLYQYLNASRNEVRVYGSGGGTNYTFKELEKEICLFLDAGTDCIKMKVGSCFGTKMNDDIERVKFVRKLIGSKVQLAVDANQVWTRKQAIDFISKVENQDIAWLEEPIHSAAYTEIEKLCKMSVIKIAYGESERTAKMFPALVNAGVMHLQPIPTQLGGVEEWQEVRDLALKYQLDFSSGGYSMYTASLLTTAPEVWPVEYLHVIMRGLEEYFMVRPQWKNGKFLLPDIEGLPIRIDWNYWKQKNKIVAHYIWTKDQVPRYEAAVNI